jgi:holliday junction DNA helicase RuvB
MIISSHKIKQKTESQDSGNLDLQKKTKQNKKQFNSNFLNNQSEEIEPLNQNLRPTKLLDYIGQEKLKKQLNIILQSSKIRNKLPEHILFYGQPGLGKTTLANLISQEVEANFKVTSAPALQKIGDLVTLLLNLSEKTILFIDEIHRLKAPLEEALYTAMEDRKIDLVMGKGAGSSNARLDLKEFTLIGATTQLGKISKPLKDRFGSIFQLEAYNETEILEIIERNSKLLELKLETSAEIFLCQRCRGIPRIANNLLKRLRDYALVHNLKIINKVQTQNFLLELGILEKGLTRQDIIYLQSLSDNGLGIKTLSGILLEEVETLELVIEPYLLHLGFIDKSSSGRNLTPKGKEFLKKLDQEK